MLINFVSYIFLLIFLSSCGVYKTGWECPPGTGVGCAPIGEVLDMIVERENEEDCFVKDREMARTLNDLQEKTSSNEKVKEIKTKSLSLRKDDSGKLKIVEE